jgi:hypothetical protein
MTPYERITVNNKIKAFVKKNERKIKIVTLTLTTAGVIVTSIMSTKFDRSCGHGAKNIDDLTEEEWEHLIGMAQKMDEYVAERRALKTDRS